MKEWTCGFCHKPAQYCAALIAKNDVAICNVCLDLAKEVADRKMGMKVIRSYKPGCKVAQDFLRSFGG